MAADKKISEMNLIKETLHKCKIALIWLVGTSLVINVLMLTQTIYMLQLFSRVLSGHRTETLLYLTLIALILVGSMSLLMWIRGKILASVARWLSTQLIKPALIRSPDQILRGVNYGTQALSDVNQVAGFITSPGMVALLDLPWIPVYLLVLYLLHPLLGALTLIGAIVLVIFAVINEKYTRLPFQEANQKFVRNQLLIDASLRNSETIQAMGMMNNILGHWYDRDELTRKELAPTQNFATSVQSFVQFFRIALQILIMGLGAYLVLQNELSPGGMIAGSLLLSRALSPLENSIGSWQLMARARIAYKRLFAHLQIKPRTAASYLQDRPKGLVEIQELYYVPPDSQKAALENISLVIPEGETVAIIGASGSGKTTLARILMGVYPPTRGSARLDGVSTYLWDREDFGKHVGYLPQDIELFEGTVAQNIARMGDPDPKLVSKAAIEANVHEQILRLPKSYETESGLNGSALSGGLRQRIALARALWGDPSMLVLDEPNSNLDDEGIQALGNSLIKLKLQKRTIILITHLRHFLQLADKILVLNQGKLMMYGPAQQVLEKLAANVPQIAAEKRNG